jgi:hypothetical protein
MAIMKTSTVDPDVVRAEVVAFYGPHAERRVFRAGTWVEIKRAERMEECEPGSMVTDFIDLIDEARTAYRRTWRVEEVIEAACDLRARGYRDIELNRDGSILVRVDRRDDPEREHGRATPWVPVIRFEFDPAPERVMATMSGSLQNPKPGEWKWSRERKR